MSPKHQVRHFSDILPNLIVALDGFPGYNRVELRRRCLYRTKWWTHGEQPDTSDVWDPEWPNGPVEGRGQRSHRRLRAQGHSANRFQGGGLLPQLGVGQAPIFGLRRGDPRLEKGASVSVTMTVWTAKWRPGYRCKARPRGFFHTVQSEPFSETI